MNNLSHPLVSVSVITYNSSHTILETLESIKAQTYQTLELIISDDCSTDNTIDICREWIAKNGNRFVRTEILESPSNTGISANCNRAEDVCTGEWEKLLAGDDLLLPECIETYMKHVAGRHDLPCIFSRVQCFSAIDGKEIKNYESFNYHFFNFSREEQLNHLIYEWNCIPAASVFFNLHLMRRLGIRNDERIPMLEDWPKWINILNAGYKLEFLNEELVKYRVSVGISTTNTSPAFYYSGKLVILLYLYPEWAKRNLEDAFYRLKVYMGDIPTSLSVREQRNMRVGSFILSPLYWIKKRIRSLFPTK